MSKSTRRNWMAAISSLIVIPILPRALGTTPAPPPATPRAAPRTLLERFAALRYPRPAEILARPAFTAWEETPRRPITLRDLETHEEHLRYELHGLRVTRAHPQIAARLEAARHACHLARQILHHQPTGRPFTFRYTGGTTPGRQRTVLPTLAFHVLAADDTHPTIHHPLYLQAYCLDRLAPRTFRLDRIENLSLLTVAAACSRQA